MIHSPPLLSAPNLQEEVEIVLGYQPGSCYIGAHHVDRSVVVHRVLCSGFGCLAAVVGEQRISWVGAKSVADIASEPRGNRQISLLSPKAGTNGKSSITDDRSSSSVGFAVHVVELCEAQEVFHVESKGVKVQYHLIAVHQFLHDPSSREVFCTQNSLHKPCFLLILLLLFLTHGLGRTLRQCRGADIQSIAARNANKRHRAQISYPCYC